jgi:arginase
MSASIRIIGVPMDLGQSRRGVDMGPAALRYGDLVRKLERLGCRIDDAGNVEVPVRDTLPPEGGLAFLPAVVRTCEAVYQIGRQTIDAGDVPLYLGGDHSIALGTVAAAAEGQRTGLLWIDAHGDFNTPDTSPSGNLHGMPLAALTGRGIGELTDLVRPGPRVREEDVVMVGVRDLDPREREALRDSDVTVFTMADIDRWGIGRVAERAMEKLSGLPRVHVSLDMDALDPREAPGVGTPVAGGLTYREAHLLMEIAADSLEVDSIDVVEINPILDDRNRTSELAIELILSALGKAIL